MNKCNKCGYEKNPGAAVMCNKCNADLISKVEEVKSSTNTLGARLRQVNQASIMQKEEQDSLQEKKSRITEQGFFDFLEIELTNFAYSTSSTNSYELKIGDKEIVKNIFDKLFHKTKPDALTYTHITKKIMFETLQDAQVMYNRLHGTDEFKISSKTVEYAFNYSIDEYKNLISKFCISNDLKVNFITVEEEGRNTASYNTTTGTGSRGTQFYNLITSAKIHL